MAILYRESPRSLAWPVAFGCVALALGAVFVWVLPVDVPQADVSKVASPLSRVVTQAVPPHDVTDSACDVRCAAGPMGAIATKACLSAIGELASFGVRWPATDVNEVPFDRFGWRSAEHRALTLGGSRAEFRNGNGAYLPVDYECDFDIATLQVIEARARPRGN